MPQNTTPIPASTIPLSQSTTIQNSNCTTAVVSNGDDGLSSEAFLVPTDYVKGQYCFTKPDRSMMRLYNICDQAGSPRYLMDKVMSQLNTEISFNQFDPCHPSLTKRNAFMARMHRKFPSPPPQRIEVKLESLAEPVIVYRFDAVE